MSADDIFENPFDDQLTKYRWVLFWCTIIFLVFLVAVQIYFDVPTMDASAYLGDIYIIYLVAMSVTAIALILMCFVAGAYTQLWLFKKATDKQLDQLRTLQLAEENPDFKTHLTEALTSVQKKKDNSKEESG